MQFPVETHVAESERVMFQVKVTGTPTPKLMWYHNGEAVFAEKDGTLTLLSAESKHSGLYKLVAQNPAGKIEREVRLFVEVEHNPEEPVTSNPVKEFNAIAVVCFGSHVERNHRGNNQGFISEYEVIKSNLPSQV